MKTIALSIVFLLLAVSAAFAANNSTVTVTATVVTQNQCKFTTTTAAVNFGTIDPTNTGDVTVSAALIVRCVGKDPLATFIISDDGLYELGPDLNRMKHATLAEYLPYDFTVSPVSATIPKNTDYTVTVTGTLKAIDHQNAYPGSYTDIVVLTITP